MSNSLLRISLGAVIGAVVFVVITFLIGDAVSGPLMVTPAGADQPEELAIGAPIVATVIGALVGIGLAALVKQFGWSASIFGLICLVGLVAYGALAFSAGEHFADGVWLNAMHLAAAIPIVGLLYEWLRPGAWS